MPGTPQEFCLFTTTVAAFSPLLSMSLHTSLPWGLSSGLSLHGKMSTTHVNHATASMKQLLGANWGGDRGGGYRAWAVQGRSSESSWLVWEVGIRWKKMQRTCEENGGLEAIFIFLPASESLPGSSGTPTELWTIRERHHKSSPKRIYWRNMEEIPVFSPQLVQFCGDSLCPRGQGFARWVVRDEGVKLSVPDQLVPMVPVLLLPSCMTGCVT